MIQNEAKLKINNLSKELKLLNKFTVSVTSNKVLKGSFFKKENSRDNLKKKEEKIYSWSDIEVIKDSFIFIKITIHASWCLF